MKVSLLLADYAATTPDGKLTVVGAGWNMTGPQVGPMAIGMIVEVPWGDTNRPLALALELQDEDGQPARIGPEAQPIRVEGQFEVGRAAGHPAGTPVYMPIAFNFAPLPLQPGRRYVWVVRIADQADDNWRVGFNVRPAAP